MATNMALRGSGKTWISVRAWYQGSTPAKYCNFYYDGNWFATEETSNSTNWTTPDVTVNGLSPSTTYKFHAVFKDEKYNIIATTSNFYYTTDDAGSAPASPSNLTVYETTTTSVSVSWDRVDNASAYEVYVNGEYIGLAHNAFYNIDGLYPGGSFYVCVRSLNEYGSSGFTCTYAYTDEEPDTEPPSIWNVSATPVKSGSNYNVKVSWSASDDVGISHHWAYRSPPNIRDYVSIGYELSGSARSYTFTTDGEGNPFKAGNTYYFEIRVVDTSGNLSSQSAGRISVTIQHSRPNDWSWSYSIYSGGEFYDYSSDGITLYLMPAYEWNNFTKRINEFRIYKGLSTYDFTYASSSTSSYDVTNCINEAISAINDMLPTGKMSTISSNSIIYARTFTNLRDKLNSIT